MPTAADELFQTLGDIAEQDFDYLTSLREQHAATGLVSSTHEQAVRRLYVRMFVTLVESTIATLREEVLAHRGELSDAEVAILRDVVFDLNDKGEPFERPLRSPLLSTLKFAFRMLSKVRGLTHRPDYSNKGWQDLQEVVRVRNRLTHPKKIQDLTVSSDDMQFVDSAELWFRRTHTALLQEYSENLRRELEAVRGHTRA